MKIFQVRTFSELRYTKIFRRNMWPFMLINLPFTAKWNFSVWATVSERTGSLSVGLPCANLGHADFCTSDTNIMHTYIKINEQMIMWAWGITMRWCGVAVSAMAGHKTLKANFLHGHKESQKWRLCEVKGVFAYDRNLSKLEIWLCRQSWD